MFEDKAMAIQINETMLSICTLLNYSISRMEGNTISVKEKKKISHSTFTKLLFK